MHTLLDILSMSAFAQKLIHNAKEQAIAEQKRKAAEDRANAAAAAVCAMMMHCLQLGKRQKETCALYMQPKPHAMPFREEDVFTAWEILSPAGAECAVRGRAQQASLAHCQKL